MSLFGKLFGGGNNEQAEEATMPKPPIDETALVQFVDNEFKRRQDERRPYELQWRLNIAFVEGNQYVDVNPVGMTLEEIPQMFWWQEREVFNHIAPTVETRTAKLGRMRPIMKVRPGSNAQEDIRAAKVGTQLTKTIYYDQDIQNKLTEFSAWMEVCGSVFSKNVWNPNLGAVIAMMEGPDGQPIEVREGDLECIVVPPQEIYPDSPYHQGVKNCRSIIHARNFHIDEVEEIWGKKVDSDEATAMQLQRSMIGVGGLGYGMGGFRFFETRLKDHALVKEYWEMPSKKYPKGRLIIVASKKLLYYTEELPYMIGQDGTYALPFVKVDCIERPGCFWGRTVVERLIPLQRRYNALRNRKAEYLNRAAIGHWLVQEESIDLDTFEQDAGSPGAITLYKRGFNKPEMAQTPPLPAAFETELSSLLQEMSMISGVSELSRQSAPPPNVKSGVALSLIQEQDDTRLSSTAANLEVFIVENGKQWLRFYKQFVPGVRTLRAIGKNNVVELIDWTGADIRSEDVIIESASSLAESPAQRRQMVFDLIGTGLFNENSGISKEDRNKILEAIDMGLWDAADDDDELHISKAERENRVLTQGQLPPAVSYDDHVLHISRHNKFRLTTDYEELLAQVPEIEQIFEAHVQMHMIFMAQQMQAMITQQAAQTQNAQGSDKGKGGEAA